jgi:predicted lactoylglutathione lyase
MTGIQSVSLQAPDPAAAEEFYATAFGLGDRLLVRAADAPATGFRGFMLSLVAAQPNIVDTLLDAAIDGGATTLKPAAKSFWGYGGVVQAPDGAIWKIASSAKKNSGPATREIDDFVLLLGVADVKAAKQFYVDHGLSVTKSFGSKYVEFDAAGSPVKLALYSRRAAAKDAGVSADGTGSHRIVIAGASEPFTDPDGYAWEAAATTGADRAPSPARHPAIP